MIPQFNIDPDHIGKRILTCTFSTQVLFLHYWNLYIFKSFIKIKINNRKINTDFFSGMSVDLLVYPNIDADNSLALYALQTLAS